MTPSGPDPALTQIPAPADDGPDGVATPGPRLVRNRVVRLLLVTAGTVCVVLGLLGLVMPLLPTTPFLLLAAACYVRSSERAYQWLYTNPIFGEYLRRYRDGEGIPLLTKLTAVSVLWVTLGASLVWVIPERLSWVKLLLAAIGLAVTIHVLRLPTRREP